jgi:hypothetical protein
LKRCNSQILVLLSSVSFSCSSSCLWFGFTKLANLPSSCLLEVSVDSSRGDVRLLLLIDQSNLQVVELRISKLLAQVIERMLELVFQVFWISAPVLGSCGRHVCRLEIDLSSSNPRIEAEMGKIKKIEGVPYPRGRRCTIRKRVWSPKAQLGKIYVG